MYKLNYFSEADEERAIAFMKANSFAVLCANSEPSPVATHVPLDIQNTESGIVLTGHIMKNSDHHKAFLKNENVLVIFNGPHTYISASWYTDPKVASTWNYITVHAKGKIKFADEDATKIIIEELTNQYEGKTSDAAFKNLPEAYVNRLVKAITGFTITIESMDNVFKLSQNHTVEDRESIIAQLNKKGNENSGRIAHEMQERITQPKLTR